MSSFTSALAADPLRSEKRRGAHVMPQSRIVDAVLGFLFVPFTALMCIVLSALCGFYLLSLKIRGSKSSRNVSTGTENGSRTARAVLQARAHCAAFGYGPDSMAASLLFAANWVVGGAQYKIFSLVYWITVVTFWAFRRDVYAFFKNMLKGTRGSVDSDTYNHLRTCWIDDFVESFVESEKKGAGGGEEVQVVILGAGYDSRAYGRLQKTSGVRVSFYEVDSPATQRVKRKALESIPIEHSHVRFVSVDFETENWMDKLCTCSDFDVGRRCCVVWEGITMYLTEEAIKSSLANFERCKSGSMIGFDFLTKEHVASPLVKSLSKRIGEEFIFGMDDASLQSLVKDYDLRVIENLKCPELVARYASRRANGQYATGIKKNWAGFAILESLKT